MPMQFHQNGSGFEPCWSGATASGSWFTRDGRVSHLNPCDLELGGALDSAIADEVSFAGLVWYWFTGFDAEKKSDSTNTRGMTPIFRSSLYGSLNCQCDCRKDELLDDSSKEVP